MPTNSPAADPPVDPLDHRVLINWMVSRPAESVAEHAIELWEPLSARLVMIIGHDGFNALFDRSMHATTATYHWLAQLPDPAETRSRFGRLKAGLQSRDIEEARNATALHLTTFTGVLQTLIGQQLTHNILRAAWGAAYEQAAQELSPCPKK